MQINCLQNITKNTFNTFINNLSCFNYFCLNPLYTLQKSNIVKIFLYFTSIRMYSGSEKKRERENTSINSNTNFREIKLIQINIDYCLLQFDAVHTISLARGWKHLIIYHKLIKNDRFNSRILFTCCHFTAINWYVQNITKAPSIGIFLSIL